MAKRPSVKEILEAARQGGAATPSSEPVGEPEAAESTPVEVAASVPPVEAAPAAEIPTAASLGRPLTLKEKMAAARAGGSSGAAPAAPSKPAAAATSAEPKAAAVAPATSSPPLTPPLGRPLTLQEKLAQARTNQAGSSAVAHAEGAKPAAVAKPAVTAKAIPTERVLPPLEEITDPRDLAEALRRKGAEKAKEAVVKAAPSKPAARPSVPKPGTALPTPTREEAGVRPHGSFSAEINRRGFVVSSLFVSWIALAWAAFAATSLAWIMMCARFMFPNVLAEPPTTIKIGLPSKYEPEEVNESYKAEWGFWVVRTTRYDGQDIIYALQSICTHLGCPPNWLANEQKFKCPCHGSGFYVTGVNFEGPAPRPLERFKVALADDGQIMVEKSQKFQEELQQWADPDSFIPV